MKYIHENIQITGRIPAQVVLHNPESYYVVENHWHRSLEMTLMLKPVHVLINGRQLILREREILLVNSGDIHKLVSEDPSQVDALTVILPYDFLTELCPEYDSYYFELDSAKPGFRQITDAYMELHSMYSQGLQEYDYLKVNEIIYHILYCLFREFRKEKKLSSHYRSQRYIERFKTIMNYIDTHSETNLTLETISQFYGISREYLARSFRTHMGCTFKEYLDSVRLHHAYIQLMETEDSILTIAMDNGFPDVRSLIHTFKKIYGQTPYQYRLEHMQRYRA